MNFVKTNYQHEFGGQRITPYGIINFNSNGVCAIKDDALAQKVAACSQSLFLADEDDAVVQKAMDELKKADAENNKPIDDNAIGEFIKGAGAGAIVESSDETRAKVETIGEPAGEGGSEPAKDDGSFKETPQSNSKPEEGGEAEEKVEAKSAAPIADTNPSGEGSDDGSEEEGSGNENSDDLITSQLEEFEAKDIREMIESANIKIPEGDQTKESLIKIAVENKIMD